MAERHHRVAIDKPATATLVTISASLLNTSSHVGLLVSFCTHRCHAIPVPSFHPGAACGGSSRMTTIEGSKITQASSSHGAIVGVFSPDAGAKQFPRELTVSARCTPRVALGVSDLPSNPPRRRFP